MAKEKVSGRESYNKKGGIEPALKTNRLFNF
jgi:hypothetical protein